jgi:hypothetical protein
MVILECCGITTEIRVGIDTYDTFTLLSNELETEITDAINKVLYEFDRQNLNLE